MQGRFQQQEPYPWQRLQRQIMAPFVAATTVVVCGMAAVLEGIVAHPATHITGIFCAAAIGGALAGSLIADGHRHLLPLVIALATTAAFALLVLQVARAADVNGNALAAADIRSWIVPVVAGLGVVCFAVAWTGGFLRRLLRGL